MSENERLEAVAKAIFDLEGNWDALIACSEDPDPAFDEARFLRAMTLDQAAAALAAADQFGIDAALDGVHEEAAVWIGPDGDGYRAEIRVRAMMFGISTGPTRTAAILDACRKAKEQK